MVGVTLNERFLRLYAGGVSLISRDATDHNILIFARHFLQSFNVEGSKGHRPVLKTMAGCLYDYFSLLLCLFETCSKEKPSALSCIQVQMLLYSVNVFLDKNSSWAIAMMMFVV